MTLIPAGDSKIRVYTAKEIAWHTRRAHHSVAVLAARYAYTDTPLGFKIGRDWFFTEDDLARIRQIPPRRGRPPKPAVPIDTLRQETTT